MTDVDELRILITGDISAINSKLDAVERKMDGLGGSAGRTSGLITRGFAAGGLALAGVTAGLGAAGGAGLMLASNLENARIGFSTMLGSAQKADEFMREMADFAAATPFELAGVQDGARRLLAMGFAAESVIPMLGSVGDAVAAMGGSKDMLDGVTVALGQMQAKGKVSSQEMLQLAERGIPAWDMLARKLGTDVPTAMKQVERGAVSAATFMEAFQEGVAQRFGGAMEKQSKTFMGQLSTLKDNLSMTLADTMKPALEAITAAMPAFSAFVAEAMQIIGPAIKGLFEGLGPMLSGLSEALAPFLSILQDVGPLLGSIFGMLGAFMPTIGVIFEALAPVFEMLIDVGITLFDEVAKLAPLFEDFARAVMPIVGDLLSLLGPMLTAAIKLMAPVLRAVLPIFTLLASVLAPIVNLLASALIPLFELMGDVAGTLAGQLEALVGWFVGLAAPLANIARLFADVGKDILLGLINGLKEGWEKLKGTVGEVGERVKSEFKSVFGIASPSRVFKEYGIAMSDGLSIGLQEGMRKIAPTAAAFFKQQIGGAFEQAASDIIANVSHTMISSFTGNSLMDDARKRAGANLPIEESRGSDGQARVLNLGQGFRAIATADGEFTLVTPDGTNLYDKSVGDIASIMGLGTARIESIIREQFTAWNATPFAQGGIVSAPTLGLVGEAGPEAIIPLDRLERIMGARSQPISVSVTINMPPGAPSDADALAKNIKRALMREMEFEGRYGKLSAAGGGA